MWGTDLMRGLTRTLGRILECPHCRSRIPTKRKLIAAHLWSEWRCSTCGSLLAFDQGRRFLIVVGLAMGLWLVAPALVMLPLALSTVASCTYLLLATIAVWRADRIIVLEPRSQHCWQCGYNLTGNVSGVCPECGTEVKQR